MGSAERWGSAAGDHLGQASVSELRLCDPKGRGVGCWYGWGSVRGLIVLSEVESQNEFHHGELEGSYFGGPTLRKNAPDVLKSCVGLKFGAILSCRAVMMWGGMFRK